LFTARVSCFWRASKSFLSFMSSCSPHRRIILCSSTRRCCVSSLPYTRGRRCARGVARIEIILSFSFFSPHLRTTALINRRCRVSSLSHTRGRRCARGLACIKSGLRASQRAASVRVAVFRCVSRTLVLLGRFLFVFIVSPLTTKI
jgi:hypothetical protein